MDKYLYVVTDIGISMPCEGIIYGIYDTREAAIEAAKKFNNIELPHIINARVAKYILNKTYDNDVDGYEEDSGALINCSELFNQ